MNGDGLGDTLTPYNSSSSISHGGDYHPLVLSDSAAPVVNTVALNDTAPNTGDAILVTVNATDNVAVTNVTADGVELTSQGENIWNGTITAVAGTNYVNVSAKDAAGNTGWNNSTSYTATTTDATDPVVNTVALNDTAPNTGDAILVTVNATDNVAVTNVAADGVELTSQGENIWNGTITAVAGTNYVNVSAKDAAGNTGWNNSTSYTATTTDATAPIITNVANTTPTSDSVTITWTTDENSTSLVWYGTSTGNYNLNISGATMVTAHTATLTGLSHDTVYYFVVNSTDSSGNSNESAEYNFTTAYTNSSISGIVTDSITGRPIRDATVSAGGMTADTWTDGTYTITSITPGTYSLNVTAADYAWNNTTAVTVSSGAMNSSGNVTLMPEKVTLTLKSGETAYIKSAPNGTKVVFNLTATNYGTNATFMVTNSSDATVVASSTTFTLNSSESASFNITATNQTAGYYPVTVTVAEEGPISDKSASITLYAIMQNMSANYTAEGSTINTTNNASVTGSSVLDNSTVDTGANVNGSTLVHANVTGGANITGGSLIKHSNVTGSGSRVENGSVVEHSTLDNSTMDNGATAYNSTVTDSAVDNTTATYSKLHKNTMVTDSTIVNVTANESTITGVEIDTGYDIILINATVEASTSGGTGGRPEIRGDTSATVITRGINFTNIYTDVLIENLVLQQTGDTIVPANQSAKINASGTVKCDLTVNMTELANINITETGINPDGEGTEGILPDDVTDWIPVGNFICILHDASGDGSFTIRRYYDPSLNYTEVYIHYYNTTSNSNKWERLETTANGTLGGLDWIEAEMNHLSTFVLMGTLGSSDGGDNGDDGSNTRSSSSGGGGFALPDTTPTISAPASNTSVDVPQASSDEHVTPMPTKAKPAAAKATATAAEETTAGDAKKRLPGFTAVFVIAGLLAVAYAMMRRRD